MIRLALLLLEIAAFCFPVFVVGWFLGTLIEHFLL